MNKNYDNLLTRSELIFMVVSIMLGIGVLSLPADAAKIAHEDGWIAVIVGGIYPVYYAFLVAYFSRKFPNDHVLKLNKKYYGRYLGEAINIFFLSYFILMIAAIISGYTNIARVFIEEYLTPFKITLILALMAAYTCSKGLKVLGKISLIIFIITAIIFFSPVSALKAASIKNIMPIGRGGVKNILMAGKTTIFAYAGIEVLFLIYPFVRDKKTVVKDSFIGIFITMFIYTWVTFISIYYLSADIVVKSNWPFLQVTESVTISIVNNYRYIFMFLWTLSAFKAICTVYFGGVFVLGDLIKSLNYKTICYLPVPIIFIIALKLSNIIIRGDVLPKLSMFYLVVNSVWLTLLAILIFLREDFRKGR